jgi:hypothetical protein
MKKIHHMFRNKVFRQCYWIYSTSERYFLKGHLKVRRLFLQCRNGSSDWNFRNRLEIALRNKNISTDASLQLLVNPYNYLSSQLCSNWSLSIGLIFLAVIKPIAYHRQRAIGLLHTMHRGRAIGLSHTIATCYRTIAYHRNMLSDYRIPSRHVIGLSHTIATCYRTIAYHSDMLSDYRIPSRHAIGLSHTIATCYRTIAYHRRRAIGLSHTIGDVLSDYRIPSATCYRTNRGEETIGQPNIRQRTTYSGVKITFFHSEAALQRFWHQDRQCVTFKCKYKNPKIES